MQEIFLKVFPRVFKKKCNFLLSAAKPVFRKNGIKSWSGLPRAKFLATPCVLTESSSKMILGSGGLRSVIFGLFFDFRSQKFRPLRKKRVFREVDFFEKTTKTTVLFFRGALIFSKKKRTTVTNLPFKYKSRRRNIRGVIVPQKSVILLTQHGRTVRKNV